MKKISWIGYGVLLLLVFIGYFWLKRNFQKVTSSLLMFIPEGFLLCCCILIALLFVFSWFRSHNAHAYGVVGGRKGFNKGGGFNPHVKRLLSVGAGLVVFALLTLFYTVVNTLLSFFNI